MLKYLIPFCFVAAIASAQPSTIRVPGPAIISQPGNGQGGISSNDVYEIVVEYGINPTNGTSPEVVTNIVNAISLTNATGNPTNYLFVSPLGDDATALRGNARYPWFNADVAATNSQAQPGDVIFLLPGVHNVTNQIVLHRTNAAGLHLVGSGRGITVVSNWTTLYNDDDEPYTGPLVMGGSDSVISDFTCLWVATAYGSGIRHYSAFWGLQKGMDGPDFGLTNTISRMEVTGGSDVFYLRGFSPSKVVINESDIRSGFDLVIGFNTNHTVVFNNSRLTAISDFDPDNQAGLASTVVLRGGGANAGGGMLVELNSCTLFSSGTNTAIFQFQNGYNRLLVNGCTVSNSLNRVVWFSTVDATNNTARFFNTAMTTNQITDGRANNVVTMGSSFYVGQFFGDGVGLTNLPTGAGDVTTAQLNNASNIVYQYATTVTNRVGLSNVLRSSFADISVTGGGPSGDGGVVSNAWVTSIALDTWYTNDTSYWLSVDAAADLSADTGVNGATVYFYVDTEPNGTYNYAKRRFLTANADSVNTFDGNTIGGMVSPGGAFQYFDASDGSGTVQLTGDQQLIYFSQSLSSNAPVLFDATLNGTTDMEQVRTPLFYIDATGNTNALAMFDPTTGNLTNAVLGTGLDLTAGVLSATASGGLTNVTETDSLVTVRTNAYFMGTVKIKDVVTASNGIVVVSPNATKTASMSVDNAGAINLYTSPSVQIISTGGIRPSADGEDAGTTALQYDVYLRMTSASTNFVASLWTPVVGRVITVYSNYVTYAITPYSTNVINDGWTQE